MPLFTIHSFIRMHNLVHYYKAEDQASSDELLGDVRFILNKI